MHELMVTLRAGPEGALVEGLDIDYLADGKPMTLRTRAVMGMCGTRLRDEPIWSC